MPLCPECNAQILISEDVHVGEVLICSDCQTQWEVSTNLKEVFQHGALS